MYETSDIRKGLKVTMDGYPWIIVDFQFVKPGKGTAFTRVKMKNLKTRKAKKSISTVETMESDNNLQSIDVLFHMYGNS